MSGLAPKQDGQFIGMSRWTLVRLLDEARAVLNPEQIEEISRSSGLSVSQVEDIFQSATAEWEQIKDRAARERDRHKLCEDYS